MPVYAGRIPAIAAEALRQFRGQKTPTIAVVVYGNRDYDDALLELKNLLGENGFVVVSAAAVVAQHSIFPSVASGRPDKQDKEQLAIFGQRCNEALNRFTGEERVAVKGNAPYRQPKAIPLHPSGNVQCNNCGICVKICPAKCARISWPDVRHCRQELWQKNENSQRAGVLLFKIIYQAAEHPATANKIA